MLEDSMYTVLSPEGFASILWKDASKTSEAAEVMKLTPKDLLKEKVIEGIIKEPENHEKVIQNIDQVLQEQIPALEKLSTQELLDKRYARFRKL